MFEKGLNKKPLLNPHPTKQKLGIYSHSSINRFTNLIVCKAEEKKLLHTFGASVQLSVKVEHR